MPFEPDETAQAAVAEVMEVPEYFQYSKAKPRIDRLIGDWSNDRENAKVNRASRYCDIDSESLRELGNLLKDEMLIVDRVIDSNVKKEKGEILNFLFGSFRLVIFDCLSNPDLTNLNLDMAVSKGLTYTGWYKEFNKEVDGAILHRDDSIEVVFDETKPLHVGFEHVGHDNLYYNRSVSNIQSSEYLIRGYDVNMMQLERFAADGTFDVEQVNRILNARKEKRDETICIYKVYCKHDGYVYVGWHTNEGNCDSWLKPFEPLRLGVVDEMGEPAFIDKYPIFLFTYLEDEQETLVEKKGRAFLDQPHQNANTSIETAFVNAALRASNVYASPDTDNGETSEMKELDTKLRHGHIYSKPIRFFSTEFPPVEMLNGVQFLDAKNADQTGRIAGAVANRKDSRKTAKEFEMAEVEQSKITSPALANFSEHLREIFSFCWIIIQSQALQGKIRLLQKWVTEVDPITGQETKTLVNDFETLSQEYEVRPAGDTDIIEAGQEVQKIKEDWPVFQSTPLASKMLKDLIKFRYPKKADEYIAILEEGDVGKKMIGSLLELLKGFMQPQELNSLPPDQLAQVEQIIQGASAYVTGGQPRA